MTCATTAPCYATTFEWNTSISWEMVEITFHGFALHIGRSYAESPTSQLQDYPYHLKLPTDAFARITTKDSVTYDYVLHCFYPAQCLDLIPGLLSSILLPLIVLPPSCQLLRYMCICSSTPRRFLLMSRRNVFSNSCTIFNSSISSQYARNHHRRFSVTAQKLLHPYAETKSILRQTIQHRRNPFKKQQLLHNPILS